MTIAELERLDTEYLTIRQVADCLYCDPRMIRILADRNPGRLGFPVQKNGPGYRIPREPFLAWARGVRPAAAPESRPAAPESRPAASRPAVPASQPVESHSAAVRPAAPATHPHDNRLPAARQEEM